MEEFQPNKGGPGLTGAATGLSRSLGGENGGSGGVGSFQSGDGFGRSSFMGGNEGTGNGDGGGGYGSFGGSHGQTNSAANMSYRQFVSNAGGHSMANPMMANGPMTGSHSMTANFNGGGGGGGSVNGVMSQGYGRMNSMSSMSNGAAGMMSSMNNFATSSMQQFGADGNSGGGMMSAMSGQDRRRSSSSSIGGGVSGMPSHATLNQMAEERLEKLQMIQRLREQVSQDKMGNYHQQSQMGGGVGVGGGGAMGAGATGNMPDSYYAGMMAGFGMGVSANPSGVTSSQKNFPETLFGKIDVDCSFHSFTCVFSNQLSRFDRTCVADVVSASDRHGHIISWLPHGQVRSNLFPLFIDT